MRVAPENNEANRALEALIAKAFGVAKSKVSVTRGRTARMKMLEIEGVSTADIDKFIQSLQPAEGRSGIQES